MKRKICRCGRHVPHLKQYLKELQIMKVLNKKPTIPADFNCPSGDDQLTRVRFTYGCKLRAGAHTSKDRLDHSQPDVIELFH